jgi:hypothetical protein
MPGSAARPFRCQMRILVDVLSFATSASSVQFRWTTLLKAPEPFPSELNFKGLVI